MNESEIRQMRISFSKLNERRLELLDRAEVAELADRVRGIRESSLENLQELISVASESFSENGVEFHLAADGDDACRIIYENLEDDTIAKSKSNTLSEIGLADYLRRRGVEVIETDLGDRILQLAGIEKPAHPVGPALHLGVSEIAAIVRDKLGADIGDDPHEIMAAVRSDILQSIAECDAGITGANSVAASDGSAIIVHNEGNVARLSLMDTHILVFGIDKLVPEVEDAISVVKLETAYATGTRVPSYINVISGPSKTADIEKMLLRGMYGASRVIAVAVDNGRSTAYPEALLCIGCGSCIVSCPVYNTVGNRFGYRGYLGGRGVVMSSFIEGREAAAESGLYMCTLCGLCTEKCPVETPTAEMVERLRGECVAAGMGHPKHLRIAGRILRRGSPL